LQWWAGGDYTLGRSPCAFTGVAKSEGPWCEDRTASQDREEDKVRAQGLRLKVEGGTLSPRGRGASIGTMSQGIKNTRITSNYLVKLPTT
jgi:hypothetical protein